MSTHEDLLDFDPVEPLCLLLVDGPNVQITIKQLWIENTASRHFPAKGNIDYESVAKAMQQRYGILPENMEKVIFLKRQKDFNEDPNAPDTYFNQERFKHAMRDKGWHVVIRAQADNTSNGEKLNDIDDDLLAEADEFIAQAEQRDVLLIMSGDFNTTPGGNSTVTALNKARKLQIGAGAIAFPEQWTRDARNGLFDLIDMREIEGAFGRKPPKARTIADVEPGEVERFFLEDAPVVRGRRPNKSNGGSVVEDTDDNIKIEVSTATSPPRLPMSPDFSGVEIPSPQEVAK